MGEGSVAEVQAMGQRVAHRGEFQRVWSPAQGVILGQASHRPFEVDASCQMATDWNVQGGGAPFPERYARLGQEALAALRGSFAIALCEGPNRIVLSVDQVGYKSLFYSVLRGRLVFASEYKALLALHDLPLEPDRSAIQHYLSTKYPLGGRSFLARARTLQGGHMLEFRDGNANVSTYWRPATDVVQRSREEHVSVVRDALLETVHRQIHTYEHVGITLGGGLDAALVLGAMRRVAPDVRISSFTVGSGEEDWEIVGARQTAQAYGTEHHEYLFDPSTIPEELPRLVWLTEDCGGREEAMLQMRVLREAGAQTSVVFGGHGADVLFGGMPRHRLVGLAEKLPMLTTPFRELFQLSQASIPPSTYIGRAFKAAVYGRTPPETLHVPGAAWAGVYWSPEVNEFIRATIQRMHSFNYLEPQHEIAGAAFHSPFLDPDMIATSLTVPGWLKSGWRRQKWVLREAGADLLPDKIRKRKKAIQRLDVQGEMGAVLSDLAGEWLVDSAIEQHQLLTPDQLQVLRRQRDRARQSREVAHRLWSVLSLECWARHFLSSRRGAPSQTSAAPE
ncbi:MAG TPA: asparagine synthase-related protein [Gemmatimonadales bacterium]|nr:asparagine synthase-related protein [Gemmatimonadales bacterium]